MSWLPRAVAPCFAVAAVLAQDAVRLPERFERILWIADAATGVERARAGKFTGVQLGRGVDPAPVVAAGLRYYLDQPVGKGVLELRDDEMTVVRQAYEKERDPATLVRPGCFATPGRVETLAHDAGAEATRVAGPGLAFVALADEASATRHDAPIDTCRCADCTAAFRAFAKARYRTIGACNEALGTDYERFEDVEAPTTDQVRRRELGDTLLPADLRPFAARLDFVDAQYAEAMRRVASAVQQAVPGVPVGLTGLSAPAAFGGNDPARLGALLTLVEPYDVGGAVELWRDLAPGARGHRYATLAAPAADAPEAALGMRAFVRARLADLAAHGTTGVVVWNDAALVRADGAPTPFGSVLPDAFTEFGPALDTCAGAEIEDSGIWIVESQASVRLWWMLDSAGDGMTWMRRLASYEASHSTSQAARAGWLHLLRDLGFQPKFVAATDLVDRLPNARPRCLVLPAAIALGDAEAQAIASYVKAGGVLLADHTPGIYREDLLRRDRGALDDLFGITARSLRWDDLLVREGRAIDREKRALPRAERGLRGSTAQRGDDGDAFVEADAGRGHAVCLNTPVCEYVQTRLEPQRVEHARELRRAVRSVLERAGCREVCDVRGEGLPTCVERVPLRTRTGRNVLAIRLDALDAPKLLAGIGRTGPRAVRVELPQPRHLRVLGGKDLGTNTQFEVQLDPFGALFLEDIGR